MLSRSEELLLHLTNDFDHRLSDAFTELTSLVWNQGKELDFTIAEIKLDFCVTNEDAENLKNVILMMQFVHNQECQSNIGLIT